MSCRLCMPGQRCWPATAVLLTGSEPLECRRAIGGGLSCVAKNHTIYYDKSHQLLDTFHNVDDVSGCCAECRKFNERNSPGAGAAGTGGAAAVCQLWTFCGPGGNCTLPGDVSDPPPWTVMTAGDCVLLSSPYYFTGQRLPPDYGSNRWRSLAALAYCSGAQPGLLQPDELPAGARRTCLELCREHGIV